MNFLHKWDILNLLKHSLTHKSQVYNVTIANNSITIKPQNSGQFFFSFSILFSLIINQEHAHMRDSLLRRKTLPDGRQWNTEHSWPVLDLVRGSAFYLDAGP